MIVTRWLAVHCEVLAAPWIDLAAEPDLKSLKAAPLNIFDGLPDNLYYLPKDDR